MRGPDDTHEIQVQRIFRVMGKGLDRNKAELRDEMIELRDEHEERLHGIPRPQKEPPEDHLEDEECQRMIEAIEDEGLTLPELVDRFDRAPALIKAELAAYCRQHNRAPLARALQAS